jgi:hypothetical protein
VPRLDAGFAPVPECLSTNIWSDNQAQCRRRRVFEQAMGARHCELMDAAAGLVEALPFGFVKADDDQSFILGHSLQWLKPGNPHDLIPPFGRSGGKQTLL